MNKKFSCSKRETGRAVAGGTADGFRLMQATANDAGHRRKYLQFRVQGGAIRWGDVRAEISGDQIAGNWINRDRAAGLGVSAMKNSKNKEEKREFKES